MSSPSQKIVNAWLKNKRIGDSQSGVAMMSAILMIMVITMLSILVIGITMSQVKPTLFTNKNTRTLAAAQSGIDSAISQIRNATSPDQAGTIMGDIHKLPCRISGPVDGLGDDTSFSATIAYFKQNPEGQDSQWRTDNALACYTGPTSTGLRAVPYYAIVTSEGFDGTSVAIGDAGDRIIEAKYTFPLITRNVSGGQITDASQRFCLVADTAAVGSEVKFRTQDSGLCTAGHERSSWSWRSDYMIHLSSTDLDGRVPLCLSGRATNSDTPQAMKLKACTLSPLDPDGQRFAWTGHHTWQGQTANNSAVANSYIVNADSVISNGDKISVLKNPGTRDMKPVPLPDVGKGNASKDTEQVVNQSLFGRCLDVTDTLIDKLYMITYPCKQDPSGNGNFDWNHKWRYNDPNTDAGVNELVTAVRVRKDDGSTYCLYTPNSATSISGSDPTGNYRYPRFSSDCTSARTQWRRTNLSENSTVQSWAFIDNNGRCLSSDGPTINGWKSIIVETCSPDDRHQQWNVPEDPIDAAVGAYEEVTSRD